MSGLGAIKAPLNGKLSKADLRRKVRQRLNGVGSLFYWLGVCRFHDDGDVVTGVYRWWHPLSWLLVVAMVIPCAVLGEPLKDAVPFRVSKYWRNNHDRLNWL